MMTSGQEAQLRNEVLFNIMYSIEIERLIAQHGRSESLLQVDRYEGLLKSFDDLETEELQAEFENIQALDAPEVLVEFFMIDKAYAVACDRLGLPNINPNTTRQGMRIH